MLAWNGGAHVKGQVPPSASKISSNKKIHFDTTNPLECIPALHKTGPISAATTAIPGLMFLGGHTPDRTVGGWPSLNGQKETMHLPGHVYSVTSLLEHVRWDWRRKSTSCGQSTLTLLRLPTHHQA